MFKVTMEYKNIFKYFTHVSETDKIHPCNKEIMKYMKNFTTWYDSEGNRYSTLLSKEYHDYEKSVYFDNFVEINDYLVFEFPDEETAFYFKMKFC